MVKPVGQKLKWKVMGGEQGEKIKELQTGLGWEQGLKLILITSLHAVLGDKVRSRWSPNSNPDHLLPSLTLFQPTMLPLKPRKPHF